MDTRAADALDIETPESVAFRLQLAGIGSRGLALLVDTAVIVLLVAAELLVVLLLTWLAAEVGGVYNLAWSLGIFGALAFITYWGYFIWYEAARNGRTWGKKRIGLRVVRDDGSAIGFTESAIRNLVRMIDMMPGMYGAGMVSAMVSRRGKRLGDMAAGTLVIRDQEELSLYYDGDAQAPEIALIREFLARQEELTEAARLQVASELMRLVGEDPQGLALGQMVSRLHSYVEGKKNAPTP